MNSRYLQTILDAINRDWECNNLDLVHRGEKTEDGDIRLFVFLITNKSHVNAFGLQSLMALGLTDMSIKTIKNNKSKIELEFNLR